MGCRVPNCHAAAYISAGLVAFRGARAPNCPCRHPLRRRCALVGAVRYRNIGFRSSTGTPPPVRADDHPSHLGSWVCVESVCYLFLRVYAYQRRCSLVVEHQLPKLRVRVRFPSPAPVLKAVHRLRRHAEITCLSAHSPVPVVSTTVAILQWQVGWRRVVPKCTGRISSCVLAQTACRCRPVGWRRVVSLVTSVVCAGWSSVPKVRA